MAELAKFGTCSLVHIWASACSRNTWAGRLMISKLGRGALMWERRKHARSKDEMDEFRMLRDSLEGGWATKRNALSRCCQAPGRQRPPNRPLDRPNHGATKRLTGCAAAWPRPAARLCDAIATWPSPERPARSADGSPPFEGLRRDRPHCFGAARRARLSRASGGWRRRRRAGAALHHKD